MVSISSHGPLTSANDSLLRSLVAAAPVAMYLLDDEGVVRLWNPAAERMFGWREAEVVGRLDPTSSEEEEVRRLVREVGAGGERGEQQLVRLHRSGRSIEICLSASRVLSGDGLFRGILLVATEIGERRRIERERDQLLEREREARERAEAAERRTRFLARGSALLDASLDYTATLNNLARLAVPALADYCLIDELENDCVTRVALAHVNPMREPRLRRNVREPLTGDPSKHPVLRVMRTGRSVLMEKVDDRVLEEIAHDPEHLEGLRSLDLHSFVIVPLEKCGNVLGAMTLAYAESRRTYASADLEMAEELARRAATAVDAARLYRQSQVAVQARERLLAVVSHDLRNSLATVLLNSSAILESTRSTSLPEPILDQLQWIARSAEQMNRLISDLLDVSAIEQGRLALDPSRCSVSRLLQDAAHLYAPLAAESSIRLEVDFAPGVPDVLVDPGRFQQVIGNLLTNALKFSPPEAAVVLRGCPHAEGGVQFSVEDRGPGISPEQLAKIFERVRDGGGSRRGRVGLGLGIARGIVEAHGGRIWVDSEPGVRTTFSFTVPAAV